MTLTLKRIHLPGVECNLHTKSVISAAGSWPQMLTCTYVGASQSPLVPSSFRDQIQNTEPKLLYLNGMALGKYLITQDALREMLSLHEQSGYRIPGQNIQVQETWCSQQQDPSYGVPGQRESD